MRLRGETVNISSQTHLYQGNVTERSVAIDFSLLSAQHTGKILKPDPHVGVGIRLKNIKMFSYLFVFGRK